MKLTKYNQQTLQSRANNFSASLTVFLEKNPELKPFIQGFPIDHLAIKSDTSDDYETFVNSVKYSSLQLSYTPMDNRRIATATLKRPINLKSLGQSNILEIIEPKPEKSGTVGARFDHIEIRNPNFPAIEKVLNDLKLEYSPYQNPNHKALVIVINDLGQEIKFTDSNLAEIVKKELTKGHAFPITDD